MVATGRLPHRPGDPRAVRTGSASGGTGPRGRRRCRAGRRRRPAAGTGRPVVSASTRAGSAPPACPARRATVGFGARNFGGRRPNGTTALRSGDAPISSHFFGQSSFATHAVVSARSVVKVPDRRPREHPRTAGMRHPDRRRRLLNSLDPAAGSTIAVFGAGAVGDAAILAAQVAACSTIIAVDRVAPAARLRAATSVRHTGSTSAIEDPVERIKELTGGAVSTTHLRRPGCPPFSARPSTRSPSVASPGLLGSGAPRL